jgi:hypothetical protein
MIPLYICWAIGFNAFIWGFIAVLHFTKGKKVFREITYEELPPNAQKEFDRITKLIKSHGGEIQSFKIETDDEP